VFKSLFSKYLAAFIAIILICFTMLILVGYSIVINYAADAKIESARAVVAAVDTYLDSEQTVDAGDAAQLSRMLHLAVAGNDRLALVLTDENGALVAVGSNYDLTIPDDLHLPDAMLDELRNAGEITHTTDYRAAFGGARVVLSSALLDEQGNMIGVLTVCSPSSHWVGLLSTMARTIIMASLWIMLAALIAVYFISERVSAPLREMRRAVKDFAGGDFGRRVVVQGNDEIAELGMAFNQMAQSLENLEKMRSGFMANVSHDLRTPMTTISGFIDAIRDGLIPPDKQDHYLGVVSAEVHRLSRLVSSLLDITRIQAGDRKFVMKPFDICEMGRQILISFEQQIEAKGLQIEFVCDEENMIVLADHDAIYQIFYNICDNAVKFSFDGGVFRVGIQRKTDEKNKIQVSVYNQGEGIAAEDIPFVFERFYKGDKSRGLDRKGVGLGLYICKTIIAAHGEEIWVNSVQGKDCRFSFTLTEQLQPKD
jgi:signal transduction histidine kinase